VVYNAAMSSPVGAFILVMVLVAGCGRSRASQSAGEPQPPAGEPQVCTRDAKVCPDGSTVGRTGPNCEFAPCAGAELPADE
jgi:hypothetical protein